jgi:hypothetical protein
MQTFDRAIPSGPAYNRTMPWVLRALGGRWRDGRRSCRMKWGDLNWGQSKLALALCLFSSDYGPGRFSLHVAIPGLEFFLSLPFLERFAHEPHEIMESWGFSTVDGALHLHWGRHYKILSFPWNNWKHLSHEVRRADGSWTDYVASYETRPEVAAGETITVGEVNFQGKPWKEPDGRHTETYPYRYLLRSGEVQEREATIHVERWTWRLRWLDRIRITAFDKVRHSIAVAFSDEVGERSGSWKGGCVGCSYDLKPDETPRECLKRMEAERRF